jgi:1-pyrroline-5-carboxylate dehydrogenase
LKAFATIDPENLKASSKGYNLVNGEWTSTEKTKELIDPLNGNVMFTQPDTQITEIKPFVDSLASCPKSGLHNPFKNKERYIMLGEVCRRLVQAMDDKDVYYFFLRCIQRTCPKSLA